MIVVQVVIMIIKVLILLSINLLKVFCIPFILRIWMMCVVWAVISWVFCADFTLLSLDCWLICYTKITSYHLLFWIAEMSIRMVRYVRVVKLSYWPFFYESMIVTLIFEDIKIIYFFTVNLIAFEIWKILIVLKVYAVNIGLLLLMKAKMLDLFWLIEFFIILKLILMIIFTEKKILVLIMTWMKLVLRPLKMMMLVILSSGNEFCFGWTNRIMMMLPVVMMVRNSIISYLLSIIVVVIFLLISL